MAAGQPQSNAGNASNDGIQSFTTSLQISSSTEACVLEILAELPDLNATTLYNASAAEQIRPLRIDAGCKISRVIFGKSALLEDSDIKQTVSQTWSQTCWESPVCVIQPKTSLQVSQALKIITFLRIPFAIRSGGHSPNTGWANLESGILIDLAKLNNMTINDDRKIFRVGPGARWGQFYEFLDPWNILLDSKFRGRPDGRTIVNANAQERDDLFWASKDGGPNFGIVTGFDLYTIPVKNIWSQMNIHRVDQGPILLEAFAEWQKSPGNKGSVAMPVEKPETFAPFYNIPPLVSAVPSTIGTVDSLSKMSGASAVPAPRHDYRGASSKIDADLYKSVYAAWKSEATTVHNATGANATFVLQHIPKNVVDKANANGGNALGLDPIPQQLRLYIYYYLYIPPYVPILKINKVL
ncbi:FAD-binding domain-containing protein [Byssothecium circinans]|uniref:FAD-binding domain-containing protein n=1 Tax=Byssothecium circinans TaxID=147558 RepID=A0A6A5TNJ6_9PLEO|nr:FAD-binding domain-containing protein [Byssothecium circinans]